MIEIIILGIVAASLGALTRRRGGNPWLTVPVLLVGYVVVSAGGAAVLGRGPHFVAALVWIVLCFVAVFVIFGGGKRHSSTWQCPECHFFNEPTTLVCPCGHRAEA